MPSPSRPVSRYQRRILAWGGALACVLFVVGAPIYLGHVEDDLTERVAAELAASGYEGVTVSFSGQTGTIACTQPLSDPQDALDLAYDVRGVHAMDDLPDACRVRSADDGQAAAAADASDDSTAATTTTIDDNALTDFTPSTSSTTTTVPADFASVADIVGGNPQFSLLQQLVQEGRLGSVLLGDGLVTLFAPTDAAFDALPADAVAQLRSDPVLLEQVLRHHLVEGRLLVDDLATGSLTTMAGDELAVDVDGDVPMVGGASIVEPDVLAANGVVHAVDQILLPTDVDLSSDEPLASANATYVDGGYVLQGVVRSEVERSILVDVATATTAPTPVVDELTVDPDIGLDEATATALGSLVTAMPGALLSGEAGFDGTGLYVTGTYVDAAQRDLLLAVASDVNADAQLAERPEATEDDAVDLEAALNTFVMANPVLFQPSSSVLDETASPILDEIARLAQEFAGVSITVEGHTDSDGGVQQNLILSQLRALAVQEALVERGFDPASVTAEGFGSTRPILVDGVEDKTASRRVEFRVVVS